MKRIFCALITLLPLFTFAQTVCNEDGNILVYSNFEGGIMDIVVDKDIQDLKIGINSYYNVDVRISGPYSKNVVAVYTTSSGRKGSCNGVSKSTVMGVQSSSKITTSDLSYFAPCGGFEGGTSCNEGYLDPTYTELIEFFEKTAFPGSNVYSFREQFACWSNKRILVSEAGNCCPNELKEIVAEAGPDKFVCVGQGVQIGVRQFKCDFLKLSWSPAEGLEKTTEGQVIAKPTKTTKYTLTLDNGGKITKDEMVVYVKDVPKVPVVSSNSPVCIGEDLQLNVSPNTGETYAWEGPNNYYGFGASILTKNADKTMAGTYTVYADLNGCGTTATSIKVVMKSCSGKTAQYSNANKPVDNVVEELIVSKPKNNKPTKDNSVQIAASSTGATSSLKESSKSGTTSSTTVKFQNTKKNGVFLVTGFEQQISNYVRFEVQDKSGKEIDCRRQKFEDKLIVDVSDKPYGIYTLILHSEKGTERADFVLNAQ